MSSRPHLFAPLYIYTRLNCEDFLTFFQLFKPYNFLSLGKLSLKEYIGDMYRGEDEEEEPDWVKSEREQFNTYRDKDGDGFMDEEEVKNWILPQDFDHAEAEARHLIYEADADADEQLTKDEVLKKYDLFVGSQATDFGEALARHDEF